MIGTRPEAIKLAPLVHALVAVGVTPRLLLTGQHPDLRTEDHGLAGVACDRLGCVGQDDPMRHAAKVAAAIAPLLLREAPDLVVVQGDTSSALGGALAAARLDFPLAHVEAGLRSADLAMPWPEEGNRIAIDRRSDLLFAPTIGAAEHLRREAMPGDVHVTGNTGIDALHALFGGCLPSEGRTTDGEGPLDLLVTCHRRENWEGGLASLADALLALVREGTARAEVLLHPNPHVAAQMRTLFHGEPNLRLSPAADHREMVGRMQRADLLLSDSGGVQEEAPTLGVPLLVLRNRTERPEALAGGGALLVGTDGARILEEVRRLHADRSALARMARPSQPFGDGRAAPRIAAHVRRWLDERQDPIAERRIA